uniref:Putative proton-associated sugar transporter a n=2 Tax=Lutzomyia longipalpis TaxID=7200 RepID=A0A7G3AXE2_LUTLO
MSKLAWRGKDDAVKKDNFSHISRKKSLWELMRLSCIMMGIELAYSAETAFVSPILLNIGIHHKYMTMVWSLSACLSIICSPLIGPLTDQCRLALGRRRPLMIFLSVLLLLGLILVPHGAKIGLWLEWVTMPVKIEKSSSLNPWIIFCTVLGTIVLDFSADNCQTPSRAYLLDMCLPADHTRALSTFSIMSGIGSFLGYAMSAYDWESLSWTHHLGGNISTVFAVVAVIFTISALLTLTTFREVPLPVLEDQPVCSPIPSCKDIQRIQSERRKISFGAYIKSILRMPASIKILCTVSLLGWMGDVCYTLYFTDFVGETVFRGDPGSDSQSQEYGLYESGVRFGCWGMSIYAFSCILFSMGMNSLIKIFSAKFILISASSLFGLSMICLAVWPTKINVLVLSVFAGINFSTIFTVPFILIAQYHAQESFRGFDGMVVDDGKKVDAARGLGTDIAIINSSLFLAQIFVSLIIGALVSLTGSTSAVIYSAGVFSLCAGIAANRVLYLE